MTQILIKNCNAAGIRHQYEKPKLTKNNTVEPTNKGRTNFFSPDVKPGIIKKVTCAIRIGLDRINPVYREIFTVSIKYSPGDNWKNLILLTGISNNWTIDFIPKNDISENIPKNRTTWILLWRSSSTCSVKGNSKFNFSFWPFETKLNELVSVDKCWPP